MKNLAYLLLLPLLLSNCKAASFGPEQSNKNIWNYADLRLFDPVDSPSPQNDMIALYAKIVKDRFRIRIDFLDLVWNPSQDIFLLFDTAPGGSANISLVGEQIPVDVNWEFMIIIPAVGNVKIVDKKDQPIAGLSLLIVRDNKQDFIDVSFNADLLNAVWSLTRLQILIFTDGEVSATDKTSPISADAPPPPQLNVIYFFWNTFLSKSPAESMRSWYGAHSGPASSRHGLSYLLDSAASTETPIFLVDLLTEDNLSALDYIHALPKLNSLEKAGLVGLVSEPKSLGYPPNFTSELKLRNDLIWGIQANMRADKVAKLFDIFLLLNNIDKNVYYDNVFVGNGYAQFIKPETNCPLISPAHEYRFTDTGVPISCKSYLLTAALQGRAVPLILGGDFSRSYFGNPNLSQALFSYVNNIPWIHTYTPTDLQGYKIANHSPAASSSDETAGEDLSNGLRSPFNTPIYQTVYKAILQSPRNQITEIATQAFRNLSQPGSPGAMALGDNYVGQIGSILAAAKWADNPYSLTTCSQDIDYDSRPECILSNTQLFLALEPDGGYINFAFYKSNDGVHQIIGPTWELMLGISDPSEWDHARGLYSDPGQLLGAMQSVFDFEGIYNYKIIENGIIFDNTNMAMRKVFTLSKSSIQINIKDSRNEFSNTYIPLVLDPWTRFTSGWGYKYFSTKTDDGIVWGIMPGVSVEITSTAPLTFSSFKQSSQQILLPEDPNFDYSSGHYLPYPVAVVKIINQDFYSVRIEITP